MQLQLNVGLKQRSSPAPSSAPLHRVVVEARWRGRSIGSVAAPRKHHKRALRRLFYFLFGLWNRWQVERLQQILIAVGCRPISVLDRGRIGPTEWERSAFSSAAARIPPSHPRMIQWHRVAQLFPLRCLVAGLHATPSAPESCMPRRRRVVGGWASLPASQGGC
jgi:hypothetical protein